MTWQESLKLYGLVPADESLPAIRRILAREAEMERSEYPENREEDLALLCRVQLFIRGYLEDVLRIWEAKQSGMDLACSLDGHFLLGAGVEQTKTYLTNNPSPEAPAILEYIASLKQCGMLVDWSPEKHLESYRQYFQVQPDTET
jgi:hypothetical protein